MVLTSSSSSSSSSSSCASLSSLEDVSVKICSSVKFLCSYGGRIIPCYPDGRLRYIGGETRVLSVHRSISFSDLQSKLGELCGWETVNLRCQIPTEDLDALVSITSDEDLANLMEEYDLASRERQRQIKVRAFLYRTKTKSSKSATPPESPISPIFSTSKASVRPTLIHSGVTRCPSPARFYGPVCKTGGYLRFHGHPASGCCLAAAHRRVLHHSNY